eukprot:TRINITY_DN507_c0_g3_i1.p1 TRINITY_DN507_c0_g3~~TRINITY_DN507_c0_g3_i1.p1  ORF type:complete len:518 (+),score=154.14 TRINITY_DN507_c0_g3_i1:182-1735(+)
MSLQHNTCISALLQVLVIFILFTSVHPSVHSQSKCRPSSCTCECKNGPYFFQSLSGKQSGLGVFLERLRLGVSFELASNMRWIPPDVTPGHTSLTSKHDNSWQDLLGFRLRPTDCNECSMWRKLALGELETVNMDAEVTRLGKMKLPQVCAEVAKWQHQKKRKPVATKFSEVIAHHNNTDHLVLFHKSIKGYNRYQPGCLIHWYPRYYELQYASDMSDLEHGHAPLVQGREPLPFNRHNDFSIGVHFRAGDLLKRTLADERVFADQDLLILAIETVVRSLKGTVPAYLYMTCEECTSGEIEKIAHTFPALHVYSGNVDDTARDLDLLAHTDVIIIASSSYAALALTLNVGGVGVTLKEHRKYDGWPRHEQVFVFDDLDLPAKIEGIEKRKGEIQQGDSDDGDGSDGSDDDEDDDDDDDDGDDEDDVEEQASGGDDGEDDDDDDDDDEVAVNANHHHLHIGSTSHATTNIAHHHMTAAMGDHSGASTKPATDSLLASLKKDVGRGEAALARLKERNRE